MTFILINLPLSWNHHNSNNTKQLDDKENITIQLLQLSKYNYNIFTFYTTKTSKEV